MTLRRKSHIFKRHVGRKKHSARRVQAQVVSDLSQIGMVPHGACTLLLPTNMAFENMSYSLLNDCVINLSLLAY